MRPSRTTDSWCSCVFFLCFASFVYFPFGVRWMLCVTFCFYSTTRWNICIQQLVQQQLPDYWLSRVLSCYILFYSIGIFPFFLSLILFPCCACVVCLCLLVSCVLLPCNTGVWSEGLLFWFSLLIIYFACFVYNIFIIHSLLAHTHTRHQWAAIDTHTEGAGGDRVGLLQQQCL